MGAAFERLAHRFPQEFEISKRSSTIVRLRRKDGPKGALCEIRLGSFFDVVSPEEISASTLMIMQVCLPQPVWPRVQKLLKHTHTGCRILMYEDMRKMWDRTDLCPFIYLGGPNLACTWSPEAGHRFNCYERDDSPDAADNGGQEPPSEDPRMAPGNTGGGLSSTDNYGGMAR